MGYTAYIKGGKPDLKAAARGVLQVRKFKEK